MSWLDDLVADSPVRSKIGWQGELEFHGASEDDKSGRVARFRVVRRPDEVSLAHPFARFSRRRGKAPGTRFSASIVSVATEAVAYAGEIMLLNWGDGPGGATLALLLDQEAAQHPFLGYARPSRAAPGSRFMAVFVEIDDDEEIVTQVEQCEASEPSSTTRTEPAGSSTVRPEKKPQRPSNAAALWIKAPRVPDWLREEVLDIEWTEQAIDRWLKQILQIDSKADLDKDPFKAGQFEGIRRRFANWLEEQEGTRHLS